MKRFLKKFKSFFYHKNTFMLIPHTEKKIISIHISNLNLSATLIFLVLILVFGFLFSFKLSDRMNEYDYYLQENVYYKDQIDEIHNVLPSITKSQNTLFGKLDKLFNNLGVENISENMATKDNSSLDAISMLENIDDKMENVTYYIKYTKVLFSQIPSIFPLTTKSYWFSSPFGYRLHPVLRQRVLHTGMDIATVPGTPVLASAEGYVKTAGWSGPYGISVFINHESGYGTRYAHLMRTAVGQGAFVKKGQVIGYVGSTGMSTGYHLHYEVLLNDDFLDPVHYLYLDKFGGI